MEDEMLQLRASYDRSWAALVELSEVRPDRSEQREAIIAELGRFDPKVCSLPHFAVQSLPLSPSRLFTVLRLSPRFLPPLP